MTTIAHPLQYCVAPACQSRRKSCGNPTGFVRPYLNTLAKHCVCDYVLNTVLNTAFVVMVK